MEKRRKRKKKKKAHWLAAVRVCAVLRFFFFLFFFFEKFYKKFRHLICLLACTHRHTHTDRHIFCQRQRQHSSRRNSSGSNLFAFICLNKLCSVHSLSAVLFCSVLFCSVIIIAAAAAVHTIGSRWFSFGAAAAVVTAAAAKLYNGRKKEKSKLKLGGRPSAAHFLWSPVCSHKEREFFFWKCCSLFNFAFYIIFHHFPVFECHLFRKTELFVAAIFLSNLTDKIFSSFLSFFYIALGGNSVRLLCCSSDKSFSLISKYFAIAAAAAAAAAAAETAANQFPVASFQNVASLTDRIHSEQQNRKSVVKSVERDILLRLPALSLSLFFFFLTARHWTLCQCPLSTWSLLLLLLLLLLLGHHHFLFSGNKLYVLSFFPSLPFLSFPFLSFSRLGLPLPFATPLHYTALASLSCFYAFFLR